MLSYFYVIARPHRILYALMHTYICLRPLEDPIGMEVAAELLSKVFYLRSAWR